MLCVLPGSRLLRLAHQPQGRLERAVVDIARAAEERVVRVQPPAPARIEQAHVGVGHGRRVQVQRLLGLRQLLALALQVGQFREGVQLFRRGLLIDNVLQAGQQPLLVASELTVQRVAAEHLHGPFAGLAAAAAGELQPLDQRIVRRRAHAHPLRGTAAGRREQQQRGERENRQSTSNVHAWLRGEIRRMGRESAELRKSGGWVNGCRAPDKIIAC